MARPTATMTTDPIIETRDGAAVVRLAGRLTVTEAEAAQPRLLRAAASRPRLVVIDLTDTEAVSAAGVGLLLMLHRKLAAHGGSVALANPGPNIQTMLRLTRVDLILPVWPRVEDALTADPLGPAA